MKRVTCLANRHGPRFDLSENNDLCLTDPVVVDRAARTTETNFSVSGLLASKTRTCLDPAAPSRSIEIQVMGIGTFTR